jgi:hypothetical protein
MLNIKVKISEKKRASYSAEPMFLKLACVQQFGLVNYRFFTVTVLRPNNRGLYTRWGIDILRVDAV